jgi:8-oxo-dGTP pyrophosphatase MutT (NUDIX family)
MSRASGVLAAMKAVPGGARYTPAPSAGGWGGWNQVASNAMYGTPWQSSYGPFLPRPSQVFTDGAFGPMSPIQPVPVDQPAIPGGFPGPRWWQYQVGWNLPTLPGAEGLKLASFDQLRTIAERYSVARRCIELRKDEIAGLEWEIALTKHAAKAYQGDRHAMRDFGERAAAATRFFRHPDPDFFRFQDWFKAILEQVLVFDALSLVFRPKYGRGLGRGLLGSDLDSIRLVDGETIRPLLDMHGGKPAPPAPAYQQYLYGVPRSDYQTVISGADIDEGGLAGAEVNAFRADVMLYRPFVPRRTTPYGYPPVEQALLPIISGLQKQEFQLDYFTQGTIPAVYISPGDANMTPGQIKELQDALNGIAGDPAYHLKVIVLPAGSRVNPQRPVDLSDGFDLLVQTQVCMQFDVNPAELGILPMVAGSSGSKGPSTMATQMALRETDVGSRKSTKPLLLFAADIFNYVLQDICGQQDMEFKFAGLTDDEDKAKITELGVQQVQNGIASVDEVRDRLDMPPWGLRETSEPVVFTAQGPVPFSMAPDLIRAAIEGGGGGGQGTNTGQRTPSSRSRTSQPSVRRAGQVLPGGTHPKPLAPHRESLTPQHSAAAGAIQSPTPRTGGTPSRSPVAGSRKRGEAATARATHHKAAACELDALRRHLRKGRAISTWAAEHIPPRALSAIAEDLAKGVLIDTAVERAGAICLKSGSGDGSPPEDAPRDGGDVPAVTGKAAARWPGWEHDLGLVGAYKQQIARAFRDAEARGSALRKKAAAGGMFVSGSTLRDLISGEIRDVLAAVLTPLWTEAWHLGYAAARSLVTGEPPDFTAEHATEALRGFIATEGEHWLTEISRTGLEGSTARAEMIAWTETGRAINSAAIQCYRDYGVTHKHLLLSPDACDLCKDVAEDGDIPLDAPFSAGGVIGQVHVRDRCVPAPSQAAAEPPLADLGKAAKDDETRASFLLIRSRCPEDGKHRYLLHLRSGSGEWDLPGGTARAGEDPWDTALREAQEETGPLPPLKRRATLIRERGGKTVSIFLCDAPFFQPSLQASAPDETLGAGWYRRKEIGDLNLSAAFRSEWESVDWKDLGKALQRMASEDGEELVLTPAAQALQAAGSRWPYPHRADGTEEAGHWPDAGPGAVPDGHGSAGGEPPHWEDDFASGTHPRLYPRGDEDGKFPVRGRKPAPPAAVFPDQGSEHGGMWPAPQNTLQPPAAAIGARTGIPPSGDSRKSVSDFSDPSPVDAEHVYLQMAKNFPADAISWVRRARWVGPVWVPWDRVDTDDEDKWAASHQPGKVNEFVTLIREHKGHVAPSVLVQEPGTHRAFIVDGHHRALARKKLGQKVLAYVGNIDPGDRMAALETHDRQIHSGSDPENV